jgi:CBS domain-containing protein
MKRWTVGDVMTEHVVTVAETTPYKEIVDTLATHAIGAVPVLGSSGRVTGVVSEADLLHKMEFTGGEPHARLLERKRRRSARAKASAETAADLMSRPPVVVSPAAPLAAAARLMDAEGVKRLPVVDGVGRLVGILSRRDLLRVYLREDEALREEIVTQVLERTLWIDPGTLAVTVDRGVVTLAGTVDRSSTMSLLVSLVAGLPGVVDVVSHLTYHVEDGGAVNRHRVREA